MRELEERLGGPAAGPSPARRDGLRARLLARAESEGLIDLAYERHDSPFGTMLIAAGHGGILRIALAAEPEDEVLAGLAGRVSPRIARMGRAGITDARAQLDDYFAGSLRRFDLRLDWQLTRGFRRDVLRQASAIPYGSTASYSEMAARAGRPKAVRAAGSALAKNPLPIVVPCHRVLRSDGSVGSYLGGSAMKSALLELEARAH